MPTILNVDPDTVRRSATTQLLQQAGLSVHEAVNIPVVAADAPDLVLLGLPYSDGLAACRFLESDPGSAAIPVLLRLASFAGPEVRAQAWDSGADGLLPEPVEAVELVAHVRAALRRRLHGAGKLAHELGNLLVVIGGKAEQLLQRVPPDHPIRPLTEEIEAAVERATSLIHRYFGRRAQRI